MADRPVVRIAHGYGNRRKKIDLALRQPLDMIEADLWYWRGRIRVRHERRSPLLPILYDNRPSGSHSLGPYALPLGRRWYLRLDVSPISLEELVSKINGKRQLLLDLKGRYRAADKRRFIERLAGCLRQYGVERAVRVCGGWPLLDQVRAVAPELKAHYSLEHPPQWEALLRRLDQGDAISGICIHRQLLDDQKARLLQERGIEFYSWTVNEPAEAARLMSLGVSGIISDDLALLSSLGATARLP